MEKPEWCNNCCKDGKHYWIAVNFASYSRNQGKYYYQDWNCSNCNIKIFGSSSACQKCGKRRPKREDWYCKFHSDTQSPCNYLNHSKNTKCRQCGAKKFCWLE